MNILDRLLMVLLSIWGLLAAVVGMLFVTGAVSAYHITIWSQNFRDEVTAVVICVLFALVAARFLVYRVGQGEPEYVILPGDYGHIRISFDTFEQLADQIGRGIRGVESFETRVRHGQAGIALAVRVRVLPDVDITQTGQDVQRAVKSHIERATGVTVERITVNVAEIALGALKSGRSRMD